MHNSFRKTFVKRWLQLEPLGARCQPFGVTELACNMQELDCALKPFKSLKVLTSLQSGWMYTRRMFSFDFSISAIQVTGPSRRAVFSCIYCIWVTLVSLVPIFISAHLEKAVNAELRSQIVSVSCLAAVQSQKLLWGYKLPVKWSVSLGLEFADLNLHLQKLRDTCRLCRFIFTNTFTSTYK